MPEKTMKPLTVSYGGHHVYKEVTLILHVNINGTRFDVKISQDDAVDLYRDLLEADIEEV